MAKQFNTEERRQRECIRLLRILTKQRAELEWPCQNPVLRQMEADGLVERVHSYKSQWGGRTHAMSTIAITPAGNAYLNQ